MKRAIATLILSVGLTSTMVPLARSAPGGCGRILYAARSPRGEAIFSMRSDGTRKQRLVPLGDRWRSFESVGWSPTGEHFAYVRLRFRGELSRYRLHIARADGSGRRVVDVQTDHEPIFSWAPGGNRLVYDRPLGEGTFRYKIFIYSLRSGRSRPLGEEGEHPTWSPDGRFIA